MAGQTKERTRTNTLEAIIFIPPTDLTSTHPEPLAPDPAPRARRAPPAGPTGPTAGFTLLELLVVIAIVGILTAIALPQLLGARTKAREAACEERFAKPAAFLANRLDDYAQGYRSTSNTPAAQASLDWFDHPGVAEEENPGNPGNPAYLGYVNLPYQCSQNFGPCSVVIYSTTDPASDDARSNLVCQRRRAGAPIRSYRVTAD